MRPVPPMFAAATDHAPARRRARAGRLRGLYAVPPARAFGSFYASGVKPAARRAPLSPPERARRLGVPVVAIGGITAGNAPARMRAGADAVAVITAVFGPSDAAGVEGAARAPCAAAGRATA